jgi:type II secretory pathway predicted ATPase ExeA
MKLNKRGKSAAGEEPSQIPGVAGPDLSPSRASQIPRMTFEMGGRYMKQQAYFGFSESPFQDIPDQNFFLLTEATDQLLAGLVDFIQAHKGLAIISGEEGIGKTLLVSELVQRLPQDSSPIIITRPATEPAALMVNIARAMNLNILEENLVDFTPLADAIHLSARQGSFFVVIIDDAHLLTDRHLDEIWILSQMELHGRHLLPIVLLGRPEIHRKLDGHANHHLRQFIHTQSRLPGLTPGEIIDYIDHRLGKVGSSFEKCFADDCSDQLFAKTGGCPGRINQVCRQTLERCMQERLPRVTGRILREMDPEHPRETQGLRKSRGLSTKVGAVVAAVFMLALAVYGIRNGLAVKSPLPAAGSSATPSKDPPAASTAPTPVAPVTPALTTEPDKTAPDAADQPSLPPLPPRPSQPRQEAGATPAPQPNNPTVEPGTPTLTTYRVASEALNLTKIAAKHYTDNKAIGFVAIILANPQITNEDSIILGQELLLPKVNQDNKVITLNDNRYYLLYNRYSDSNFVKKVLSKLSERKVQFQVRETHNIDAMNIYRIFLGGYEREEDLMAALAIAEKE